MKSEISTTKPAAATRKRKRAVKEDEAGRPQPVWLRNHGRQLPPPTAPQTEESSERPAALPRLLDKAAIRTITGLSFPTVWNMMRNNAFPRSRVVGGKSMWLSTEVEAWLAALPMRKLKGDEVKP